MQYEKWQERQAKRAFPINAIGLTGLLKITLQVKYVSPARCKETRKLISAIKHMRCFDRKSWHWSRSKVLVNLVITGSTITPRKWTEAISRPASDMILTHKGWNCIEQPPFLNALSRINSDGVKSSKEIFRVNHKVNWKALLRYGMINIKDHACILMHFSCGKMWVSEGRKYFSDRFVKYSNFSNDEKDKEKRSYLRWAPLQFLWMWWTSS